MESEEESPESAGKAVEIRQGQEAPRQGQEAPEAGRSHSQCGTFPHHQVKGKDTCGDTWHCTWLETLPTPTTQIMAAQGGGRDVAQADEHDGH